MFSKACEYGIRAAIYIAQQSQNEKRVSLKNISINIDSPEAFASKILQQLSRSSIIHSDKGPTGGFSIDAKKLDTINLSDVIKAIDGDGIFKGCGLGLKKCSEKFPCPIHYEFAKVRDALQNMLESTTIISMATGLKDGVTFLRR